MSQEECVSRQSNAKGLQLVQTCPSSSWGMAREKGLPPGNRKPLALEFGLGASCPSFSHGVLANFLCEPQVHGLKE